MFLPTNIYKIVYDTKAQRGAAYYVSNAEGEVWHTLSISKLGMGIDARLPIAKPSKKKIRMVTQEQQKVIADLNATIAANKGELSRAAAVNAANEQLLRSLLDQIHALAIGSWQKRAMTDIFQRLLDNAALAKRLNIELTEANARFIAILEKKHPNLNNRELRICLLIKLNYVSEEIARTAAITTIGIQTLLLNKSKTINHT